ncbi:MAG: 4-alpha-glucanotransferase [Clostridia bacterium]|nr:4-alpha-glucanotransferase [Clostridia bacterium]
MGERENEKSRAAGILLPITSLPSRYGIGCLSAQAYSFVDLLARAGQRYWQILPVGPTGYGDSPYQSFSTFAGNPYLIDLEPLIEAGLLSQRECDMALGGGQESTVDYALQYHVRLPLLRRAYHAFCRTASSAQRMDFAAFCSEKADWLTDYAHFMALKDAHGGKPCCEWDRSLLGRERTAMEQSRRMLADGINFYCYLQYLFFSQWDALHQYASSRGVKIIGDLPIYVSADSADVWANPELFCLDAQLRPLAVAGCPPDGFSAKGQLWGNPLYRWEEHAATGYAWWTERLRHCFSLYDVLRIDHFRGFEAYYSIPYGAPDAREGEWKKGPGATLFRAARQRIGERAIIAEDLGYMTEGVRQLLADCAFPGMKVLQFAFDGRDDGSKNDHLPHNFPYNCVAYTGTHDNQTLGGWLRSISMQEMRALREYLCDYDTPTARLCKPLIALLMRSQAQLCIIPLQDYLSLGDEARINTPSTLGNNWCWRVRAEMLNDTLVRDVAEMTQRYGR